MATSDIQRAIAPGSTPYGERGALEGAIATSQQGTGPTGGTSPVDTPAPPDAPMSSPLDFLGSGGHSSDLPVTSGLPMGPGPGPMEDFSGLPVDQMQRLAKVATSAQSPALRHAARLALAKLARSTNGG